MLDEPQNPPTLDYAKPSTPPAKSTLESFVAIVSSVSLFLATFSALTLDGGALARIVFPVFGFVQIPLASLAILAAQRAGRNVRVSVMWTFVQGTAILLLTTIWVVRG